MSSSLANNITKVMDDTPPLTDKNHDNRDDDSTPTPDDYTNKKPPLPTPQPTSTPNQLRTDDLKNTNSKGIERAIRFLNHPMIQSFSILDKKSFLHTKGFSNEDIELAFQSLNNSMDTIWNNNNNNTVSNTTNKRQEYAPTASATTTAAAGGYTNNWDQPQATSNYYTSAEDLNNPYYSATEQMELPNPMVPLTIGGFLSIFALATYRWLNGGDFILFPSPTLPSPTNDADTDDVNADDTNMADGNDVNNDTEVQQEEENEEEDDAMMLQEYYTNLQTLPEEEEEQSSSPLVVQLQKLTNGIEKHSSLLERKIQSSAKTTTDNAMNLLRNHDTRKENEGPPQPANTSMEVLLILQQLTEIKCTVQSMRTDLQTNSNHTTTSTISTKLEELCTILKQMEPKLMQAVTSTTKSTTIDPPTKCETTLDQKDTTVSKPSQTKEENEKFIEESLVIAKDSPVAASSVTTTEVTTSTQEKVTAATESEKETESSVVVTDVSEDTVLNRRKHFQTVLTSFVEENSTTNKQDFISSCQMLFLYLNNLLNHYPKQSKYQKIYTNTSTFKKIDSSKGAKDILVACGFQESSTSKSYLEFNTTTDSQEEQLILLQEAVNALKRLKDGHDLDTAAEEDTKNVEES